MRYDVHRHLEGSHSPQALAALAVKHEIAAFQSPTGGYMDAPQIAVRSAMHGSGGWDPFYNAIKLARRAYVTPWAIQDATYLACVEAAAECDGFEMRFSLFSMTKSYLANLGIDVQQISDDVFAGHAREVLAAVLRARADAVRDTKKPVLLRAGISRSFELPAKYVVVANVMRDHASAFSGLDVLGKYSDAAPEELPGALVAMLQDLRQVIPDLSLHAGELEGAASVARALALFPNAIGHGVRSLEDPAVLEVLRDRGITLEVCPSSNALLIRESMATLMAARGRHPIASLQSEQIKCALATDDPAVFGTCVESEWFAAKRYGADLARLEADGAARWRELPGSS